MEKEMMMVMIVYNEAVDTEVMEALSHCQVKYYTKIKDVFGKGEISGTHLGTDIWPGKNSIMYAACTLQESSKLLDCVRALRNSIGKEGIKAFSWKLQDMTV
ncbi:MAG: hypothetical protein PHU64_03685 [Candidatus Omnitrophica bacterium]|nr:hypothetical protein [Candidatus Omnitrophota bacterium]MDD5429628.1 hypothetical protein [Candidatus Omnitrophota bacterium]